jgi:AMIN domain-containing protein
MKGLQKYIGAILLLAGCVAAQDSDVVVLKDIVVSDRNGRTQVELVTSAPVEVSTSTATHPDRLIIDLPNTVDGTNLPKMLVKTNGVRSVEIARTPILPDRTRIVVELDKPFACQLSTEDEHISLVFRPSDGGRGSQGAVAAAKEGKLTGIFHGAKGEQPSYVERVENKTPPAATGGTLAGRQLSEPVTTSTEKKTTPAVRAQNGTGPGGTVAPSGATLAPLLGASATAQSGPASHPGTASTSAVTPQANGSVPAPNTLAGNTGASPQPAPSVANASGVTQVRSIAGPTTPKSDEIVKPAEATVAPTPAPTGQIQSAIVPSSSAPPTATPAPPSQSSANDEAAVVPDQPSETTVAEATANNSSSNITSGSSADSPRLAMRAADPSLRTVFKVKYVAEGVAYLDGGRSAGLKEGVKLEIRDANVTPQDGTSVAPSDPRVVAELEVSGVAESSAVTDIHDPKRAVKVGDLAYLSSADADALVQAKALSPTRQYPAVISFTDGDPEDEEARAEVPRPPLPSVNRARGRFGFDYMGTVSHGANAVSSSALGMMFRGDITRINGTYWNLSGYWRGRLTKESPAGAQTLQDLINRTYHLSMTYDNPNSSWVAGFGRLYLPWATSLDTIDGGYVGRKISGTGTVGIFGGSTPDPTSYDYAPNRSIGGAFINFTGGDFSRLHYSSTLGAGLSMLQWKPDRPFGFMESTLSYAQKVSLYDAMQVDSPSGNPAVPAPGTELSRNFFTFRVQANRRLELDFNHTYFRDIPTFDPTLVGTGLLDKYLFQGFSAGARFEFMKNATVYTQLGRSSRTGDATSSLNQMYGITFSHLPLWALRADFHYAQFNSSFGSGTYKAFSLSRSLTDNLQASVLSGLQSFNSQMTNPGHSWFVISNLEMNAGAHYFVEGSFTTNRGQMSYDQWMFTLGYRFDSKRHQQ